MSQFESCRPADTETVKTQESLRDMQANFMLEENDPALELCTASFKEKVAGLMEGSNNQEGQLIETMCNIDLLPGEKECQERLACAPLFMQVNEYFDSCNAV